MIENEIEFWPIDHPIEPLDDDHPVKCPIPPQSSSLIHDGSRHEEEFSESLRKRTELSAAAAAVNNNNEESAMEGVEPRPPAVHTVRKRQHRLITQGEYHTITPLFKMPSPPPIPIMYHPTPPPSSPPLRTTQSIPILHHQQQFNKFE